MATPWMPVGGAPHTDLYPSTHTDVVRSTHADVYASTHADIVNQQRVVPHTTAQTHMDVQNVVTPEQHKVYDVYGKVKYKKQPLQPGLRNKLFGPKEVVPVYKNVRTVPRVVTDGYRVDQRAVPHTQYSTHADVQNVATAVPHTEYNAVPHTTDTAYSHTDWNAVPHY